MRTELGRLRGLLASASSYVLIAHKCGPNRDRWCESKCEMMSSIASKEQGEWVESVAGQLDLGYVPIMIKGASALDSRHLPVSVLFDEKFK